MAEANVAFLSDVFQGQGHKSSNEVITEGETKVREDLVRGVVQHKIQRTQHKREQADLSTRTSVNAESKMKQSKRELISLSE